MKHRLSAKSERGAALVEFAIAGAVFLTALFGVIELGRFLWTHNQLKDAARRGARLAATRRNDTASIDAVKRMVVYGDPNANPATAMPLVPGLSTGNILVEHKNWNGILLSARASVSINNYQFQFSVPIVGGAVNMPNYRTSYPGESAGFVPCDIASGTPSAPCPIIPN